MRCRHVFWLAMVVVPALCVGCGSKKVKITGKILRNGTPISYSEAEVQKMTMPMSVVFRTEEGGQSYPAKVDYQQGTYEVELPAGKYRASVFVPPTEIDLKKKGPKNFPPPPVGGKGDGEVYDLTSSRTLDLTAK